jgi:hypothetical protein
MQPKTMRTLGLAADRPEDLLKARRPRRPDPLAAGLAQSDGYTAGLERSTGFLIIDRRPGIPPFAERTETFTERGGRRGLRSTSTPASSTGVIRSDTRTAWVAGFAP